MSCKTSLAKPNELAYIYVLSFTLIAEHLHSQLPQHLLVAQLILGTSSTIIS